MTAYQKLKAKIRNLEHELAVVCLAPDSQEALAIKTRLKMSADIETIIWNPLIGVEPKEWNGLINHVK